MALGKTIFEKTAGGVGCAYCHGLGGKGDGVAELGAPDIRGKTEAQFRAAIAGGVPLMSFIKLTEGEIAAVLEYLRFLSAQP
jgi:mono/diheme cytochrome c family protein